jgi:hypothetical protein
MAADAPHNDLMFTKKIFGYSATDKEVATKCMKTFRGHPWYLAPEMAGFLSLTSTKVSLAEKLAIAETIRAQPLPDSPFKIQKPKAICPGI